MMNKFPGDCLLKIQNLGWSVFRPPHPPKGGISSPPWRTSFFSEGNLNWQIYPPLKSCLCTVTNSFWKPKQAERAELNPPLGGQGGQNLLNKNSIHRQEGRNLLTRNSLSWQGGQNKPIKLFPLRSGQWVGASSCFDLLRLRSATIAQRPGAASCQQPD